MMNSREADSLETLAKLVKSENHIPNTSLPELLKIIFTINTLDIKDHKIGVILSNAACHGHQEILQSLFDAKANPNFKYGDFKFPVLNVACLC